MAKAKERTIKKPKKLRSKKVTSEQKYIFEERNEKVLEKRTKSQFIFTKLQVSNSE